MDTTHGLLCVWPITTDSFDRDALIAEAHNRLGQVAADTSSRIRPGATTWVVLDADDLDGWRDWRTWDLAAVDRKLQGDWTAWTGRLLAAVVPAEPVVLAAAA